MKNSAPTPPFTLRQRIYIFFASNLTYLLINLFGVTLRWKIRGWEHVEPILKAGKQFILVFWHGRLFPASYFWRGHKIDVLVSQHFDGEFIARSVMKQGYGVARGSSTRGGLDALHQLARSMSNGAHTAFLVDGPKGPRYRAKIGPVLLAKRTGAPILCFHVSLKHKLQLKTWDALQIPLPFSKALAILAPPICISKNPTKEILKEKLIELQTALDRLRELGDAEVLTLK